MRRQIVAERPDIIRVTEGFAELLPSVGHVIDAEPDYGYTIKEGRHAHVRSGRKDRKACFGSVTTSDWWWSSPPGANEGRASGW